MLVALVSAGCEGQSNNRQLASKDVSQELARLRFDAKNFDTLIEQATREAFAAAYPELRARFHRELSPSEVNMFQNVIRRIFLEVYPRVLWEERISTVYSK